MYYKKSSAKIFWISFFTSLVVSGLVSFSVLYFAPGFLEQMKGAKIEVPDVENLELQKAQMIVDKKNLSLVVTDRKNDSIIEEGRVISQIPLAGDKVEKGSIVRIVVSIGPGAPIEKEKEEIVVPDLTGFDLNQAKVFLAEKGLNVSKVEGKVSSKPKDVVIATVPEPGSRVTIDIPIKLIISIGPGKVEVPNLKRKSLYQAKSSLKDRGLELGNVRRITSPEYPFDIIISQDPEPGEMVEKGSKVNITINRESQ
ncbi:MAG: PASTA domain-containing protein [candidate division WOR-3 bacterium]|nr:PASTA domain-containing protein [candidate division WOR-3 bacterium]